MIGLHGPDLIRDRRASRTIVPMGSPDNPEPLPDERGSVPDLPTLVAFINAQHGTTFRITDRYLGGEQGAVGLADAGSIRFVLKWSPGLQDLGRLPEIIRIVARLRSRWYPVPRYVVRGLHPAGRYVIQAALPGAPPKRLTPSLVEQLIALNDRQQGQALAPDETWPAPVVRDVLQGGDGYCLLDPMRRHSPTTERLLGLVQGLVGRYQDVATPTADVVHCDFQPSNILAMPDRISGVVDWDRACAGDRAFDLASLLFYTYDQEPAREALWRRLADIADPRATVVYLAHLIHRQVEWSIRRHPPETVDRWLERTRDVVQELPAQTGLEIPPWP
jgi:hypothetical protein